jgi:hypothetical protein
MQTNAPHPEHAAAVDAKSAAELLQALEALRDDIITLLRGAGVTPPTH